MERLKNAIDEIEQAVGDPREGLGVDLFQFVSRLTPMVNVDLLVRNKAREILLTWRSDDFYGPGWHVPGGILRFKESFVSRIVAVANEELGTSVVIDEEPRMVQEVMHVDRDTRGHFVSLLYECTLITDLDPTRKYRTGSPKHGQWAWHKNLPSNLIKIHRKIYGSLFQ